SIMSNQKRRVAFIHTSPAAIAPLMQFYTEAAPEMEITNLLDDGLLRLLAAKETLTAQGRLSEMIKAATVTYGAELAMVTCSSVSKEMVEQLADDFEMPILKIDYPMARQAVRAGQRIGVAATFPPTLVPTCRLLSEAAAEAGTTIEIIQEVSPDAYTALLANDVSTHDNLLLEAIERLENQDVAAIVLAQVSMARILPLLNGRVKLPVLSSLHTSLEALREKLGPASDN
ncbi:MAG TPA: aspartate/glutamate racemase family protein, partial [Pyrinomonadaceae bacterium]